MAKKILMVDDEPDILKIVKYRLVKEGYEITFASNGKEGVEMAQNLRPDLIIMDFRMPILNGLEATKAIKAIEGLRHIPIIFMSASSASISEEAVLAAGVNGFLTKPFEADQLLAKIREFLS